MRIITKTAVPRRTVLKGLGATLALPLLDGMVPALSKTAQAAAPVRRLGIVYKGLGASPGSWLPATEGAGFEWSPILEPLAPFRERVLVLSGLDNAPAHAQPGEPSGAHARIAGAFLSAVHAKATDGADFRAGVTFDQMAAAQLGQHTELKSLELQLENNQLAGSCDAGYSCAYMNTLSWSTPTTPLPMENNPRAVFERLFGDTGSTDPAVRAARRRQDKSILDSLIERVQRFNGTLGAADKVKMTQYLDAIRDVEQRIQKAEAAHAVALPVMAQPAGIPMVFSEHAKLMFDLQLLAYQSDLTRVITFMLVKEATPQTYPETGLADSHHSLSHHMNDPENLAKLAIFDNFHMKMFAYYLQKLQATPDGDGTLLDHTLLLYCSGHSDPNAHDPRHLPVVVAGGDRSQFASGRHVKYPDGTPIANLYQTLLDKVGVNIEHIGDSTGEVTL